MDICAESRSHSPDCIAMQPGEWFRLSAQIPAESPVLFGLSQRRTVIRSLSLRSLQLQRFLVLRRALILLSLLDCG